MTEVIIHYTDKVTVTKHTSTPLDIIKTLLSERSLHYVTDNGNLACDDVSTDSAMVSQPTVIHVRVPLVSTSRYDLEDQLDYLDCLYSGKMD